MRRPVQCPACNRYLEVEGSARGGDLARYSRLLHRALILRANPAAWHCYLRNSAAAAVGRAARPAEMNRRGRRSQCNGAFDFPGFISLCRKPSSGPADIGAVRFMTLARDHGVRRTARFSPGRTMWRRHFHAKPENQEAFSLRVCWNCSPRRHRRGGPTAPCHLPLEPVAQPRRWSPDYTQQRTTQTDLRNVAWEDLALMS